MSAEPPELREEVDLPVEQRKYVLEAHARMAQLDHYAVLGVPRDADKKEIKRAYFQLAATVHTDRYFGKKLGSYKPKMEALFARISVAYEVLSSKEKKAQYDARLAALPAPRGAAPKAPVAPKVLAERQAAMEALKQRFTEARAKAKQHESAAALARASGDLAAAVKHYEFAVAAAPGDAALKAALEEVSRAADAKMADALVRKAQLEERYGHWT